MENISSTYQGGKKKAVWKVSISAKDGSTSSVINVLANNKTDAKRADAVKEELTLLKLTTRTAKIEVDKVCDIS